MDCHQCDGSSSMCTSGTQVPLPVDEALHQELRKNCCLHFWIPDLRQSLLRILPVCRTWTSKSPAVDVCVADILTSFLCHSIPLQVPYWTPGRYRDQKSYLHDALPHFRIFRHLSNPKVHHPVNIICLQMSCHCVYTVPGSRTLLLLSRWSLFRRLHAVPIGLL